MPESVEVSADPIRKQVVVPLSTDDAFRLFTEGISTWWPLESHSVAGFRASSCLFEGFAGGRLIEHVEDGSIHVWGTVERWDPPNSIAMSWHPGRQPDSAQRLEVTFTATESGTRVDLVHSGWEALGDAEGGLRLRYQSGWDSVLQRFSAGATQPAKR